MNNVGKVGSRPSLHKTSPVSLVPPLIVPNEEEIDKELENLQKQMESLQEQMNKIQVQMKRLDFLKDPVGYEQRLLESAAKKEGEKEGIFSKPYGSHRTVGQMMVEVLSSSPVPLNCGQILSKMENRGWNTRARGKVAIIRTMLLNLFREGRIERVERGYYQAKK